MKFMNNEREITWEFLKNVANSLDSYRIRALIDAKEDILNAGIYNENQYYSILFEMFNEERLKYSLYSYLKNNNNCNIDSLNKFTQIKSLEFKKTISLLELLKNEHLIKVNNIIETIKGDGDTPNKEIFKDLSVQIENGDLSKIRTIYEPVKVIFDSNTCSGCSICAGICPVNCLNIYNGFGKIDEDKCVKCGLCYFVCPRSYLPRRVLNIYQENASEIKDYSNIGYFKEAYSARTKIKDISNVCQDGGISSTILYHLFEKNKIDCALGAKMSSTIWRPEPILLKSKEDVLLSAGTKYVNNPTLGLLNQLNIDNNKVAVVGVPCMMQALLKSEIYNVGFPSLKKISYKIGIFCMESFSYESLLKICEILKVNLKDAKKMDINKGNFSVHTKEGNQLSIPVKEVSHLARKDCEVCFDLTSESADISVGSIGSPPGWNTVIVRTEKGKQLFKFLIECNVIEFKPINDVKPGLPLLQKIAGTKKSNCIKHITSKKEKNERFPNY